MILIALFSLLTIYFGGLVIKQLLHNRKGLRFFEEKAKNLPVLPKPNLLYGNTMETILSGKNYLLMDALHKKYGKTFGLYLCTASPWIATCDLDLIKTVMIDQSDKHTDRMSLNTPYKEFNESVFQVNGEEWRNARRALAPSLANYKVRSEVVTSDIESVVEKLRRLLEKKSRRAGERGELGFLDDADHMTRRFALAAILLVTYRRDDVVDFEEDRDKWVDGLNDMPDQSYNIFLITSMTFPFLKNISFYLLQFTHVFKQMKTITDFVEHTLTVRDKETKKRLKDKAEGRGAEPLKRRIVDELIDNFLCKGLGMDKLKSNLLLFILAGFETTASTLNHTIWQLAWNQDIQDKLRKSIIEDGGIDSEYLHWCIVEGMRTHTAVPLGYGRVITTDIHHKGMVIPKGTNVTMSTHTIHSDPEIWPEPEKYKPERWAKSEEFHPAAWLGFGIGARNCIGAKLALHEMKLMLQMLLTNYRLEPCDQTPEVYNFSSPTMLNTQPDDPMIFRFVPLRDCSSE